MPLSTTTVCTGETVVLRLAGEVDLATVPQLTAALDAVLDRAAPPIRVVVDLTDLRYLDCAGVGALVGGRARANERGLDYRVRGAHGLVAKVLALTGTLDYLAEPPEAAAQW